MLTILGTVPEYREKEKENKIEEFEEPLLLLFVKHIEYLSNIYEVPVTHIPAQKKEKVSKIINSRSKSKVMRLKAAPRHDTLLYHHLV